MSKKGWCALAFVVAQGVGPRLAHAETAPPTNPPAPQSAPGPQVAAASNQLKEVARSLEDYGARLDSEIAETAERASPNKTRPPAAGVKGAAEDYANPESLARKQRELEKRRANITRQHKQFVLLSEGLELAQTDDARKLLLDAAKIQLEQSAAYARTESPPELAKDDVSSATVAVSVARAAASVSAAQVEVSAPKPATMEEKPTGTRTDVALSNGGRLAYGLSVSLLRFSTARRADEPARLRNYSPELQLLPAEFGFQFLYRPSERPWRLKRNDGQDFQLMSWGGVLLAQIDNQRFERGGLSVAATFGFFEDTVGFGMGFDLYRGIPVASPVGDEKGGTAYTGVLAWGLARDGEVTPENVFAVVTLNLAQLAGRVTGEAQ